MPQPIANFVTRAQHLKVWSERMAPYVLRSVTGQRWVRNHQIRHDLPSRLVDEDFSLSINGSRQWLRMRGTDRGNPVVLYLHGGPGGSQIPSYRHYQLRWEAHVNVVHWEQRGAGRSYNRSVATGSMTLAQLVQDALVVIEQVANYFGRQDIILLGHSWGSLLGLHVLAQRPKAVAAYVGVGQIGDMPTAEARAYEFALTAAQRARNAQALGELERITNYPYNRRELFWSVPVVRRWCTVFGYRGSREDDVALTYNRLMETPEYSLLHIYRFLQGTLLSFGTLGRRMLSDPSIQPLQLTAKVTVPCLFVSGARDHFTPSDFTENLYQQLHTPASAHQVFTDSGHYPNEDEPDRFLKCVAQSVNPFLQRPIDLTQPE